MHYAVYDPTTGAIARYGEVVSAAEAAIQNMDDPSLAVAIGEGTDLTHYVVDGEITTRPVFGVNDTYTVPSNGSLPLAIPTGATVTVDGVGEELVGPDGFVFEADMPDIYRATISLWPYVDQTIAIEVTP